MDRADLYLLLILFLGIHIGYAAFNMLTSGFNLPFFNFYSYSCSELYVSSSCRCMVKIEVGEFSKRASCFDMELN